MKDDQEALRRAASAVGVDLSPQAVGRLAAFSALLAARAVPLGLVAQSDAGRIRERHLEDSLRAAAVFVRSDGLAYDLGSGSGLPGIVLATAMPWCRFVLIEPRRRAVAFLELAIEELGLANVEVAPARAEQVSEPADVATARAFAPLSRSWATAWPLLRPGGRLVYFAGRSVKDPLAAARSLTDPEPPAAVKVPTTLATPSPLVIMTRR
jgi:16S rRNA (guanine527-N7)-methyltransferase